MLELWSFLCSKILLLALHLESGRHFPKPLSPSQEQALFAQAAKGDAAARDKLVEHNLRLVAHICKKYYSSTNDPEDLISIGTIGLIKAVNTYSPEKQVRFSTYGARCIENELLMFFRSLRKSSAEVFLEDAVEQETDGSPLTLLDTVADDRELLAEVDNRLEAQKLYEAVRKLPPRERMVIEQRYGLHDRKPQTQLELAKKLQLSRSYVSRIEKKALEELRKLWEHR